MSLMANVLTTLLGWEIVPDNFPARDALAMR